MRRLEIVDADLAAGDMGRDRQHRHAAALAIEQAVDEMQVAGAAAAGADRQLAGQMGLGARREGAAFLVPTWIQSIDFMRRIASVKPLRESPTTP